MGNKRSYSKEIKLRACHDYFSGNGNYKSIARSIGACKASIRHWCLAYQEHGENAFNNTSLKRSYTKEFKQSVVESYVSGNATSLELCAKHNIYWHTLRMWTQKYYNGIEQTDYIPKREAYTMKSRQTTFEERLKIVKWVIDHDMNYIDATRKYEVKYQAIYSWVHKYQRNGAKALEYQQRGPKVEKPLDKSSISETERLKYELKQEKALRKQAEFELEVLKKKEEFEKKLLSRK